MVDEGAVDEDRTWRTVAAGLALLSQDERELIALKFEAGLANGDIGTVLGVSESNAGTLLHRAMTKLREACDA